MSKAIDTIKNQIKENQNKLNVSIAKKDKNEIARLQRAKLDLQTKLKRTDTEYNKTNENNLKKIDSLRYENFKLRDGQTKLKLDINSRDIKVLSDTLSKQKELIEKMNDLLNKQQWREKGKILNDEDDSLLFISYGKLTLNLEDSKRKYKELEPLIEEAKDKLKTLDGQEQQLSEAINVGLIPALFDTLRIRNERLNIALAEYNSAVTILNGKLKETGEIIIAKQTEYAESEKSIRSIYSKYKAEEQQDTGDLKAIANFTQPIADEGKLVPEITVLAFKQDNRQDRFLSYNLKLFVATSENKSTLNSEYRFFIPEASTYGFMSDFSLGFLPVAGKDAVKSVGINVGAYYLGKSIVRAKDSTTFNIGLIQFKLGMQLVVIKKVLSVYANINPFFIANGNQSFTSVYTNYSNKLNMFTDFGMECYLDLAKKQNDFFLNFDIGFITKGGDVKSIINTQDTLIPRIKLGLVKSFNF